MSEWKPIETAPKDRWILLAFPNRVVAYATWIEDSGHLGQFDERSGWFGYWQGYGFMSMHSPSHWRDLPNAPKP